MIEINLIPSAGRKKPAARQPMKIGVLPTGMTNQLRDKFMIFAIVALVASGLGIGVLLTMQEARESSLTERRDTAVRDSTRYASVLEERHRAESSRDSLLRQVHVIENLDEDR